MRLARERCCVPLLILALVAVAPPAGARRFQMSGTWVMRNKSIFLPLQFAATAMAMTPGINASMGNLTWAKGTPNGPIPGAGPVTAVGSGPATLRVPRHRFVQDARALVRLSWPQTVLIQITTNLGFDGPDATATLAMQDGPGSFTWCPGDPLCVAGGGMRWTDYPQGMGSRNGRVVYRAGANRFGGVMQMGLRRGGVVSFDFDDAPLQVGHVVTFGNPSTARVPAVGGAGSADHPETEKLYLKRGFITVPLTLMAGQLIEKPGPRDTTMLGLTNTMTGPVLYFSLGQTPMGFRFGQFTTSYGFAQTTGSVFAQQTAGSGGDDFFSFMGYDKRTALGAGNIQLVAGGLSYRNTNAGQTPYATAHRVRMSLGSPVPSLSPGAFATAGALVLIGAGYALRRRGAARPLEGGP